jgi:predicted pyridoxine 5'-phosphate oxidase superfamily flavin-nucleotide-binding protein
MSEPFEAQDKLKLRPLRSITSALSFEDAVGILTEDMKRVVNEQRLGFVATVCPDGTPNLSPKGTTAVWDDDHIVFADIRSPATVSNLRRNPSTEINVVDPFVRKGYRFKGVASVLTEGALFERILEFYRAERNLGESGIKIRSFVLVKIEEALPVVSPAYDQGLSEEQVREKMQRYFDSLQRKVPGTGREKT